MNPSYMAKIETPQDQNTSLDTNKKKEVMDDLVVHKTILLPLKWHNV